MESLHEIGVERERVVGERLENGIRHGAASSHVLDSVGGGLVVCAAR